MKPIIISKKENLNGELFSDVQFFKIAEGGAMGEPGGVTFVKKNGESYQLNYCYGEITIEDLMKAFTPLTETRLGLFGIDTSIPEGWNYVYLGAGNHLLVSSEVFDEFSKFTSHIEKLSKMYGAWYDVAMKITNKNKKNKDMKKNLTELVFIIDKIRSVIFGHAIGDALGVPVEFCSREELKDKPVREMLGFGSYPVPAGSWSDDTSMSLATLDSLAEGKIDYDDIMERFVRWCSNDEYTPGGEMFDIGRTCLTAIRNYLKTDGKPALECGLSDERSNGNGSLMRINPIVLYLFGKGYELKDAIPIVEKVSAITHAHDRSKTACGIYTCVLYALLKNPEKESIRKGLNQARRYYKYTSEFDTFDKFLFKRIGMLYRNFEEETIPVEEDEIRSSGYVLDTLEAAIWCLLTTNNYKSCILKAVNLGEDTDTVAAVAGGLAGALYGYNAIPKEWLDVLKRKDFIEEMCERAAREWLLHNDIDKHRFVAL